jgi:hypothetical protein
MRCRELTANGGTPFAVAEPWAAKHYLCEVQGSGGARPVKTVIGCDTGPPEIVQVLDTLAAEAAVTEEAASLKAWAAQMGYDADSRRGKRAYRAELRRARLLRRLLGEGDYQRLLWETERL